MLIQAVWRDPPIDEPTYRGEETVWNVLVKNDASTAANCMVKVIMRGPITGTSPEVEYLTSDRVNSIAAGGVNQASVVADGLDFDPGEVAAQVLAFSEDGSSGVAIYNANIMMVGRR